MSTASQPIASEPRPNSLSPAQVRGRLGNYAQLMKLRVTFLVVAAAWCGYFMAAVKSGEPVLSWRLLHTLLGIGVVSGGAAALNQVLEREADARMRRTQSRPLPAGRMKTANALLFGVMIVVGGCAYLALRTNLLTGYLALATAIAYLVFYTPLKQITSICT